MSAPNNLTLDGLEAIGQALFGPQWQSNLARALCVGDRSIRRYLAGTRSMPEWLPDELHAIAEERRAAITAAMTKHLPPESR